MTEHELAEEFDPTALDYDESGVDLSLIRWSLSLTPAQRLEDLEDQMNAIAAILELNARH